jgi:hypothetical protein
LYVKTNLITLCCVWAYLLGLKNSEQHKGWIPSSNRWLDPNIMNENSRNLNGLTGAVFIKIIIDRMKKSRAPNQTGHPGLLLIMLLFS